MSYPIFKTPDRSTKVQRRGYSNPGSFSLWVTSLMLLTLSQAACKYDATGEIYPTDYVCEGDEISMNFSANKPTYVTVDTDDGDRVFSDTIEYFHEPIISSASQSMMPLQVTGEYDGRTRSYDISPRFVDDPITTSNLESIGVEGNFVTGAWQEECPTYRPCAVWANNPDGQTQCDIADHNGDGVSDAYQSAICTCDTFVDQQPGSVTDNSGFIRERYPSGSAVCGWRVPFTFTPLRYAWAFGDEHFSGRLFTSGVKNTSQRDFEYGNQTIHPGGTLEFSSPRAVNTQLRIELDSPGLSIPCGSLYRNDDEPGANETSKPIGKDSLPNPSSCDVPSETIQLELFCHRDE